jgi:thymidylate synthase (FAD)
MNKIYYPLNDNIGSVQLIQSVGDDTGIVNSARVSLGKQSNILSKSKEYAYSQANKDNDSACEQFVNSYEKDLKLIKYLLEHNHGTPFEHNSLTFLVKCPLFVARQWMRHRISSFNEISARYVEVKEEFYIPNKFRKQSTNNRQASIDEYVSEDTELNDLKPSSTTIRQGYKDVLILAFENYKKLLEAGVCREQARAVLPLATYTQFYWTCNLRSFLHFVKLRDHENAQWEIQQYAKVMLEQVENIFPETIKIWKEINK